MTEPTVTSASAQKPKRRRWLRWVGMIVGCLVLLVVAGYFVLTSAAFLKGVILPKASAALNARITIADASISPFSKITLQGLKVETTGSEPLLTAAEARLRYSLWDILGGRLNVSEVAIISPTISLVTQADGSSNLDPLTKGAEKTGGGGAKQPPSTPPTTPAKKEAVQLNLQRFLLTNATVRMITHHAGGGRDLTEVSQASFSLDNIRNGQTGKLGLGANLAIDQQKPAPGQAAALNAKLNGQFDVALGADLSLTAFKGGLQLQVPQASGALAQANGFSLTLDTDLGADPNQQTAVVRLLELKGSLRDTPMLLAHLSRPLTMSWGGGAAGAPDASLDIIVTNVVLADWRAFAPPDLNPVGRANATLQLTSQQSGKQLNFNLAAHVAELGARLGTNQLADLDVTFSMTGQAKEFKSVEIQNYQSAISRQREMLATARGTVSADLQKHTADAAMHVEAQLQRLLQLMPQPDLALRSGTIEFDSKVQQRDTAMNANAQLAVRSLTGNFGERAFTNLTVDGQFDLGLPTPQAVEFRQCQLTLAPTLRAATNALNLTGKLNVTDPKAIEGALQLPANTLDVTAYYDLFAETPAETSAKSGKPETKPGPPAPSPAPPSGPETEPAPIQLPVKLLTVDVGIGHCYLRELDLAAVKTSVRIESSHVSIKPCEASVNGGPAHAEIDLNLAVPGYEYSLDAGADRVPLEPLANSFSPEYRGRAKGDLLATISLKGKGVTGPSLKSNLAGGLSLSFTNAEVQLAGKRAQSLLGPIATTLGLSEMLKSPLHGFGTDAKISAGKLDLTRFQLISPAFSAGTMGEIPLASKLSESPIRNWGVNFALSRSLAEKLNLSPKAASATNAGAGLAPSPGTNYIQLANFVKIGGTVSEPKTQTDKMALLQMGAKVLTELPGGLGKEASKFLNKTDSLLGGKLTGNTNTTNSASTNAPGTNATPASKLLDLFKPKK